VDQLYSQTSISGRIRLSKSRSSPYIELVWISKLSLLSRNLFLHLFDIRTGYRIYVKIGCVIIKKYPYRNIFFINHATSIFDTRMNFRPDIEEIRLSKSGYRSFTVYTAGIRKPNRVWLSDSTHFRLLNSSGFRMVGPFYIYIYIYIDI
jgi:hypothetical protein